MPDARRTLATRRLRPYTVGVNTTLALYACVTAGAIVQCGVILAVRRFSPIECAVVFLCLLVPPAGWFLFIRICSTWSDAADNLFLGLLVGMLAAGWCLMDQAPVSMTATAIVSLTVTFWAAMWPFNLYSVWIYPALAMSLVVFTLTFGPWTPPRRARLLLYTWSMVAAAAIAAASVHWWAILIDANWLEQHPELRLAPAAAVLMGAQFFVFAELVAGMAFLLPFYDFRRVDADYADRLISSYEADSRPSALGITLILLQTAVLLALRRWGASMETAGLSAAMLAAISHGTLSGEDAGAVARGASST